MKIFSLNLSKLKIKYIFVVVIFLLLTIGIACLFFASNTIYINSNNYTDILKDSHEDIGKYIGRKINVTGYIFRAKNFSDENFVIARDMLISENEANIVRIFV